MEITPEVEVVVMEIIEEEEEDGTEDLLIRLLWSAIYCHKLGHFAWNVHTERQGLTTQRIKRRVVDGDDYFSDFDGTFRDSVKLRNNTSMSVLGKGNVRLKVNEMTQIITGVFYVPELKNNLLSIGQLQEKGLTILFQPWKVLSHLLVLTQSQQTFYSLALSIWPFEFSRFTDSSTKEDVQNKTPEEAWGKLKPSVDYFRVFGCLSHVHVPDSKRTKLDDKSFSCVLLGVSEESKAYRLYDPISQKIIISRNVVFEEDKNWDWDKKYEEAIVCDLEWGDDGEEATVNEEKSDSNLDADIEEDTEENNATATATESDAAVTASHLLIQNRDNPPIQMPQEIEDHLFGQAIMRQEKEFLRKSMKSNLLCLQLPDPIYFEEAVKSEKMENNYGCRNGSDQEK
ncbi:Retrovirus-related Pol polyprotein from transposon TNT 1-94 [Vitis vinifera]|uniref:Retrovirus-related Pol polyprotein from transposon TNT 1-94 n=1 Tax=Vitis vinifera TaxID=29760 RepID=A0A438C6A3_VITVI|nr:Retrovirus-related Pol polyprotein from transposon TNT 1-94 [Vitis vinifera]